MATVKFGWTIEGEGAAELEAEIVEAFVLGNQGEFIQEVCGGDVMLLANVTPAQRKAFAEYKLTQGNIASIVQAKVERELHAQRLLMQESLSSHKLPEIQRMEKPGKKGTVK